MDTTSWPVWKLFFLFAKCKKTKQNRLIDQEIGTETYEKSWPVSNRLRVDKLAESR